MSDPDSWQAALIALVCCAALCPILRWLARREHIVDQPGGRKKHREPTPLLGGLAVFGGLSLGLLATVSPGSAIYALGPALAAAIVLGVIDDVKDLPAQAKLGGQALIAVLALLPMPGVARTLTGFAALDFVFAGLFLVAMMNAINFADTFDGLCGLTVVAILFATPAGWHDEDVQALAAAATGAVAGFLPWNFSRRGKLFLGDAGSLGLGLLTGWMCLRAAGMAAFPDHSPAMPLLLLAGVPLVDAATVVVGRLRDRRPLVVGARDHLSHRLVALGVPPLAMVALLALATAGSACLGVLEARAEGPTAVAITLGAWLVAALIVALALRVPTPGGVATAPSDRTRARPDP